VAENSYKTDVTGVGSAIEKPHSILWGGGGTHRGGGSVKIFRGPDGIHGESTERLSVPFSYSTWLALMRHTATPILIYVHMWYKHGKRWLLIIFIRHI